MFLVEYFDGLRHQVLGKVAPTTRSIEHSTDYLRNGTGWGGQPKSRSKMLPGLAKKQNQKASNFSVGLHVFQGASGRTLPFKNFS